MPVGLHARLCRRPQRILRKGGSLGFHRGAFPGSKANDLGSGVERDIYSAAGITKAFIDKALATDNSSMWRPTEAELLSAKVVTKVSDGNEFAIGGVNHLARGVGQVADEIVAGLCGAEAELSGRL